MIDEEILNRDYFALQRRGDMIAFKNSAYLKIAH